MPSQTDTTSSDDQPATKKDLRLLAAELRAEMHERFSEQTRTVLIGQFLSNMTLAGLLITAFKL